MNPKIVEDRLVHRVNVLRVRWHVEGDLLLEAGKYVEFTDGLLRLMRQLDSIAEAISRLSLSSRLGGLASMPLGSGRSRAARPTRRPAGGIV
jgi:hypothetical protein